MKVRSLDSLVRTHPFFQGLDPAQVDFLVGCSSDARFDPGQMIFLQGTEADRFYIIRYGQVAVGVMSGHSGAVTIQTLSEGDVLGWSWLFPPYRWHFDAQALELTRAIALDGTRVRDRCEADPKLGYELMKRFSAVIMDRLQASRMQVIDLYGKGQ